ncbi:MAG TPA: tetratricopeptide repeat protein [Flavobacterium sp.]|nr:tetratricopeptide repeat protein [Flavobacterium sp.]
MRVFVVVLWLMLSQGMFAQNDILAKEYFEKGQFEKAVIAYEDLLAQNPNNSIYFANLVTSYQELSQFDKAEKRIIERQKRTNQPNLYIDLGYNFQLQKKPLKAEENYKKAIESLDENIHFSSSVAYAFEQKNLLEKALEAYDIASKRDERFNFDFQKARIYGQLGDMELMIEYFLAYSYKNQGVTLSVQNQFMRFIDEDASDSFTPLLRKALLIKVQKTQDIYWNEYLSWFFIQQKQYDRAFIQEKAIYKRNPESLGSMLNLVKLTSDEREYDLAKEIITFVLEQAPDVETRIFASTLQMEISINTATTKEYPSIKQRFDKMLAELGTNLQTANLQVLYARFTGFNLDNPKEAQQMLNTILEYNLNNFDKATIKMELADMFLYEEKFNQALIYYSQIETDLKNHEIGHLANLKIAKTSYYKGDFQWAIKQVSVLKTSFSQLIANDALDLYLLINDNSQSDSTYTALKKFSKADFLVYKKKNKAAIEQFKEILLQHKGEEIEAVTVLRIGELLEKEQDYPQALDYYDLIIKHFSDGIYMDEALFFSAEIYNNHLGKPELAKELYERIIFEHQDSIYFVEARKEYRILRGDSV